MLTRILEKCGFNNPRKYDLRYFRTLREAVTYDGVGTAYDGRTSTLFYYKGKYVGSSSSYRSDGSVESRWSTITDFMKTMFNVAEAYVRILNAARKHAGLDFNGIAGEVGMHLREEHARILQIHPQFISLLKSCKKDFGFNIVLQPTSYDDHTLHFEKVEI